jgi:hypothetical protein
MLKIVCVFCLVNLAMGTMNQLMAQNQVANSDKIKEHVYYLTSDSLKGRETGTRGEQLAAEYLASQFNNLGLIPLADDSYFHEFELVRKHRNSMLVKSQGVLLFWPWHFHYAANYNHTDTITTKLLFAGFGTGEELEKLSIKNKALAFIAENPVEAYNTILRIKRDYGNTRFFVIFSKRSKLMEEAWGYNYVLSDYQLPNDFNKRMETYPSDDWNILPVEDSLSIYYCFPNVLKKLFSLSDKELIALAKKNRKQDFSLLQTVYQSELELSTNYKTFTVDTIKVSNVGGSLKGRDTTQTIVVTAHYDHLGEDFGRVYYGADDNASGTAALLESARLISNDYKKGIVPERNILFLAFTAEELGLYGSEAFVRSNLFDKNGTVLSINMDMVGRWDEKHKDKRDFVYLLTAGNNRLKWFAIGKRKINLPENFQLSHRAGLVEKRTFKYGSDHYNFFTRDIPVAVFFTGLHPDYHTPNDTPDLLNYKNLTNISTVVYRYIHQVSYYKNPFGNPDKSK